MKGREPEDPLALEVLVLAQRGLTDVVGRDRHLC
jgi:hypothetical protein